MHRYIFALCATSLIFILACGTASGENHELPPLSIDQSIAQSSHIVKGRVVDEVTGEMLPIVTIRKSGTGEGTTTDTNGCFSIAIDGRCTLIISYVGYETKRVIVQGGEKGDLVIRLRQSTESLPEVIVTGYSPVRKEYYTGNTTRVEQADILRAHPSNIITALQTFDPSFRIIEDTGAGSDPNHLPRFVIRGQTGVGQTELDKGRESDLSEELLVGRSNLPIFILDGFEVDIVKVYDLDVNSVHSITILKDAAATSLYGSRAANGVVVIERKSMQSGHLNMRYHTTLTGTLPDLSSYNLMSASEKLEVERLAGFYDSETPEVDPYTNAYYQRKNNILSGVDTYWPIQGLRSTLAQSHSLSVSGGAESIYWSTDIGYRRSPGVMQHSERRSLSSAFSLTYTLGGLRLQNRVSYDEGHSERMPFTSFRDYVSLLPYLRLYDADGRYVRRLERFSGYMGQEVNPLYEALMYQSYDRGLYREVSDHLSMNWRISGAWRMTARAMVSRRSTTSELFKDPSSSAFGRTVTSDRGSKREDYAIRGIIDGGISLIYDRDFATGHRLTANLSGDIRETIGAVRRYSYRGFPGGSLSSAGYATRVDMRPRYMDHKTRLLSSLLSLNYSYKDAYLMDLTCRVDGSSEFGADRRWSGFWALGMGVNLHRIPHLSIYKQLSLLRVRGSYGLTGKTNFALHSARNMYELEREETYPTGYGVYLYQMGNPDLKWERKYGLDMGIEMGLWDDRFYLKLSGYDERTVDLITDYTLPSSTGFTSYKENMGKVRNSGLEIQLRCDLLRTERSLVRLYGSLAHNTNRILEVSQAMRDYNKRVESEFAQYDPERSRGAKFSKTYLKYYDGASLTSIYGMKSLGISPSNGREIYVDRHGEVTDHWSAGEWRVIGDTSPVVQGSFGATLSHRGVSLFASFLYTWGGDAYNSTLVSRVENVDLKYENADRRVLLDRWRKPGDRTPLKDIRSRNVTTGASSRFVQRDNTLRFTSLSLNYTVPDKLIIPLRLTRVKLGLSVNDLFHLSTIRQERGLDYPYSHSVTMSVSAYL